MTSCSFSLVWKVTDNPYLPKKTSPERYRINDEASHRNRDETAGAAAPAPEAPQRRRIDRRGARRPHQVAARQGRPDARATGDAVRCAAAPCSRKSSAARRARRCRSWRASQADSRPSLSTLLGAEPDADRVAVIRAAERLSFKDPETGFERQRAVAGPTWTTASRWCCIELPPDVLPACCRPMRLRPRSTSSCTKAGLHGLRRRPSACREGGRLDVLRGQGAVSLRQRRRPRGPAPTTW